MDFKAGRQQMGLTLKKAAELSGYGIGTISDLEREGVGSDRLKEKLAEIYGLKEAAAARQYPNLGTKHPEIKEVPDRSDVEIWRDRANRAEQELADLRAGLRALLVKPEATSSASLQKDSDDKHEAAALKILKEGLGKRDRK